MNKYYLILLVLATTVLMTAFSQCIEAGELCETDEECCSGECYIIAGVGGLCTLPSDWNYYAFGLKKGINDNDLLWFFANIVQMLS